jgi:hypothetical protein
VLIAIECDRFAMLFQIGQGRAEVIECRFRGDEPQLHQSARRIIDKAERRARWPTILEPGVLRAVDLHQFAQAIAPPARLMRQEETMATVLSQPISDHSAAQGLARDRIAVML